MNRLRWMSILLNPYPNLLAKYVQPLRFHATRLALLSFASGTGLPLLNPLLVHSLIDKAQTGSALRALLLVAPAFIGLTLRLDLTHPCLQLGMAFHNARTSGDLIAPVDGRDVPCHFIGDIASTVRTQVTGTGHSRSGRNAHL